ncbi:MAG TPA: hypothetical protein ACFCUC_00455 [Desulfobacterales bacterium]
MKSLQRFSIGCSLGMLILALALVGCTGQSVRYTPADAPQVFPCVAEDRLEKSIAPEAELRELSCSFKKYEGADTLHFNVMIRNVSTTPQRFRVNIFCDNGKAVGGLIPRKSGDGLVAPGEDAQFVYPVVDMPETPDSMMLVIRTATP